MAKQIALRRRLRDGADCAAGSSGGGAVVRRRTIFLGLGAGGAAAVLPSSSGAASGSGAAAGSCAGAVLPWPAACPWPWSRALRFRLLGRRGRGGRRGLGVLLIDLLLPPSPCTTPSARPARGPARLRGTPACVRPAAFSWCRGSRANRWDRNCSCRRQQPASAPDKRDDDSGGDQTLRAAHGRFLTQLFIPPSALRDRRKQCLQRFGTRAQARRRLAVIGNQIQPLAAPPRYRWRARPTAPAIRARYGERSPPAPRQASRRCSMLG